MTSFFLCAYHYADIQTAVRFFAIEHLAAEPATLDCHVGRVHTRETFEPISFCAATLVQTAIIEAPRLNITLTSESCVLCQIVRACFCNASGCKYRRLPWAAAESARNEAIALGLAVPPLRIEGTRVDATVVVASPKPPAVKN